MNEEKKRAIAVTARDFHQILKDAGVQLPQNCATVIIEAHVGGVVEVFYRCFADDETVTAAAQTILKVETQLKNPQPSVTERAQCMFAAYWRVTTGLVGEGWRDAWEALEEQQKGGWMQAVYAA